MAARRLTWTDEEVSTLCWLAAATRRRADRRGESFWSAVESFGLSEHPIERRRLGRLAAQMFKAEYAKAVRGFTQRERKRAVA
jgi:hypothetical protein